MNSLAARHEVAFAVALAGRRSRRDRDRARGACGSGRGGGAGGRDLYRQEMDALSNPLIVAFYVLSELARQLGQSPGVVAQYLDLVALGSVADVVPWP